MPTPESALFLAKKPKVPPTFDGVDYDDTPRLKAAQDAIMREQWIQSMMARLVRQELGKCYRREGVNHLEKCAALRGVLFVPVWSRLGEVGGSVYSMLMVLGRTIFRGAEVCEGERILVRAAELCSEGVGAG